MRTRFLLAAVLASAMAAPASAGSTIRCDRARDHEADQLTVAIAAN